MKKFGIALFVLVVLVAVAITFTIGWRPFIGPRMRPVTNRTFESTPARLARGKYLFTAAAGCVECHSQHDDTSKDWPILPGTEGSGEVFPLQGLPGQVTAPNITPDPDTGIGRWTDDAISRAIREGVDKDGQALFGLMPFEHYRTMSDEDLASVVVYVRTLPPVRHSLPQTQIIFPVKYLIRSVPQPVTSPVPPPDSSTAVSRGAYLVNLGGCSDCHTPQVKGQPIAGMSFAGGFVMTGPWGSVATANITPDPTGIPYYDEKLFIAMMRTGMVHARKLNVFMPTRIYGGMTDEDLSDVFAYLKTVPPVAHRVDNTETLTLCKKCGFVHGLGDKN
jgi:mono/diheme cytochrome c family protein